KTELSQFSNVRSNGIIALTIDDSDELAAARLTNGKQHVFLCSKSGMSIRFDENDVRSMGRTARGVRGFDLDEGDVVVGVEAIDPNDKAFSILTVTDAGYGKRTEPEE